MDSYIMDFGAGQNEIQHAYEELTCRYTHKQLAVFLIDAGLYSDSELQKAQTHISNSLNPNKQEFFKTVELLVLSQRTGSPALLHLFCDVLGYERPKKIRVDEQLRIVSERIEQARQTMNRLNETKELLEKAMPLEQSPRAIFSANMLCKKEELQ